MDPPSPSKFPMSPGMPIFPVSPERVAGTKPPYGGPAPPSPSLPDLRTSPLRSMHRRNDSDVSVHGLAAMFENLEVKDPREAQTKYLQAIQKQKTKHMAEVKELEKKQEQALRRYELRVEELKGEIKYAKAANADTVPREAWDKQRQDHREAIAKWEKAMQYSEEKRKQAEKKAHEAVVDYKDAKSKASMYKKRGNELQKEVFRTSSALPVLTTKIEGLERKARIAESDLKYQSTEAEKYKNQVYGLEVDLESVEARLSEDIHTLKDKLRLVEGERDALKTSLKEEEVMRIAAEGQIPLPAATTEEHNEFGSPVRSPRKQRTPEHGEEDKENVAPRKAVVELKFLQQELTTEKRLRGRAQEQIDFMKMECQFRCCSCRIADLKGSQYVHDNAFASEMECIKASVPEMTPPASSHGDDPMEGVIIKQEPIDEDTRLLTPPAETEQFAQPPASAANIGEPSESMEDDPELASFPKPPVSPAADATLKFSPTSGTFRAVPSPAKVPVPTHTATPAKQSHIGRSAVEEMQTESSPWTPDATGTMIRHETVSPPQFHPESKGGIEDEVVEAEPQSERTSKRQSFVIHEDAVEDSEDENTEPQTPIHDSVGPARPGQYLTRTITTTTTIPLHFSPVTPAVKGVNQPLTPSTVAHAPTNAQSQALGDISLNKLPFDREAALEAIRQRRGRARSMAIGQGTPRKQMMEGVTERRDISAPVARVRR